MTVTNSISLYIDPVNIADEYIALVERLNVRNNLTKALVWERYWNEKATNLSGSLSTQELYSLVPSIINSNKALNLEFGYELLSGRIIGLDLDLYGVGYERGYPYLYGGHLRLSFSHNDLARPLRDLIQNKKVGYSTEETTQAEDVVFSDAKELFFKACGLFSDIGGCNKVEHGVMYLELGWPSPAGSSMIYHQQPQEFIKDFWRIYADYNWGTLMTKTLETQPDHWRDSLKEVGSLNRPGRDQHEFYQQFSRPDEQADIFQFLHSLTEDKLKKLSKLSENELRGILTDISLYVPEVESYDFKKCGLTIITDPLFSVWRAYKYIMDLALQ